MDLLDSLGICLSFTRKLLLASEIAIEAELKFSLIVIQLLICQI